MTRRIIGTPFQRLTAHAAPVQTVVFSQDGKYMASGDTDRIVNIWEGARQIASTDLSSHNPKFRPLDRIRTLAFSLDSHNLYASANEFLQCIDSGSGEIKWEYQAPNLLWFLLSYATHVAVNPQDHLVAAYNNGSIATFDRNGHRLGRWTANDAPKTFSLSPDGRTMVGTDGFSVSVWDLASQTKVARMVPHHRIYGFAVSHEANLVATRTLHETTIWNLASAERLGRIEAGIGLPLLDFSPDGNTLAQSDQHGVSVCRLDGTEVARFETQEADVISLAFGPGGDTVLTGCSDGVIRFWKFDS